jgi:hypothetical protein
MLTSRSTELSPESQVTDERLSAIASWRQTFAQSLDRPHRRFDCSIPTTSSSAGCGIPIHRLNGYLARPEQTCANQHYGLADLESLVSLPRGPA